MQEDTIMKPVSRKLWIERRLQALQVYIPSLDIKDEEERDSLSEVFDESDDLMKDYLEALDV